MLESSGQLFISYARVDGEKYARDLYRYLRQHGSPAWLDLFHIPEGADFHDAIDQALQFASTLLVLLTPGAVASIQVKSEWNLALNRNVPMIPLLVRDCQVPRVLNVLNVLDARGDFEQACGR